MIGSILMRIRPSYDNYMIYIRMPYICPFYVRTTMSQWQSMNPIILMPAIIIIRFLDLDKEQEKCLLCFDQKLSPLPDY